MTAVPSGRYAAAQLEELQGETAFVRSQEQVTCDV